jgi:hypothetical protein
MGIKKQVNKDTFLPLLYFVAFCFQRWLFSFLSLSNEI